MFGESDESDANNEKMKVGVTVSHEMRGCEWNMEQWKGCGEWLNAIRTGERVK